MFAELRKGAKDAKLLREAAFAEAFARNRIKQYAAAIAVLKTIRGNDVN